MVNNEIRIEFEYGFDEEDADNINLRISEIETFCEDTLFEHDIYYIDDTASIFEISFQSKWKAPIDSLQELCEKMNCSIIGISFDFPSEYVASFKITPDNIDLSYV